MQWSAYFGVERELRRKLYDLVEPGGVAIDIGSNIGEVLLHLAKRVGARGRVIGFEPNPETYEKCAENLALNPGLPADLHRLALGDQDGEVSFGRPCASNSGGDRVMADGTIRVPVSTLDRFVRDAALDRLDLVKIDVEGYELHVLRGARDVLNRFRPVLFVELSDANLRAQGGTAGDLVRWLTQHSYQAWHAGTGDPVTADQRLDDCFFDMICEAASD
jgi:FkbM family methyltransferase